MYETSQRVFTRCACAQRTGFLIKFFNQESVLDLVDCLHQCFNIQVGVDTFGERHGTGVSRNLLDHGLVYMGLCQHGDAGVPGTMWRLVISNLLHQGREVCHHKPGRLQGIQERSGALCKMSHQRVLYDAFQGLRKDRTEACLEGLRGVGRRRPLYTEVPGSLQAAERDH